MNKETLDECVSSIENYMRQDCWEDEAKFVCDFTGYFDLACKAFGIKTNKCNVGPDEYISDFLYRRMPNILSDKHIISTISVSFDQSTYLIEDLVKLLEENKACHNRKWLVFGALELFKKKYYEKQRRGAELFPLMDEVYKYIGYCDSFTSFFSILPNGSWEDTIFKIVKHHDDVPALQRIAKFKSTFLESKYAYDKNLKGIHEIIDNQHAIELMKRGECKDLGELIEVASLDLPDWLQPLHRIGKGNVGKVYRARDTFLNSDVAVKVVGDTSEKSKRTSVNSIPNLWNVSNPYVLKHHIGLPHKGKTVVIMDLFEKTLEQRLVEAGGKLPFLEAMKYFEQIADGLAACHKQKITHPDLAPYNIGIDSKGDIKIADFNEGMYPETGELKYGGIRYSAPERFKNEPLTPKSNLWSLGVILYEMLTGELLFSSKEYNKMERDEQRAHVIHNQSKFNSASMNGPIDKIFISESDAVEYCQQKIASDPTTKLMSIQPQDMATGTKHLLNQVFFHCFGETFYMHIQSLGKRSNIDMIDTETAAVFARIYKDFAEHPSTWVDLKNYFKHGSSPTQVRYYPTAKDDTFPPQSP